MEVPSTAHRVARVTVLLLLTCATAGAAQVEVAGLGGPVTAIFDADGIPHICARRDVDAIFLQGYFHARDRFFQMDTLRRTFSGTLAELVGQPALPSDVQFRTLGLRRAAEESWQRYQDRGLAESIAWFEAYAAGVNFYLSTAPLAPEYGALEITHAAPWSPIDSLVIGKGLAFGLSFDLLEIDLTTQLAAYLAAGQAQGFDGAALLFQDVSRTAPFDPTISIPGFVPSTAETNGFEAMADGPGAASWQRTAALARKFRDAASQVPRLDKALHRERGAAGSNWWVVSGSRTASGHPLIANDPHLGLDSPPIWYEIHLMASAQPACGIDLGTPSEASRFVPPDGTEPVAAASSHFDLNVNGVSFAGTPGVVLGCNTTACWGATVNPMDVTDVYLEELVIDPQTFAPIATVFEGQPEPLHLIPQQYRFNQVGNAVPDDLADAGIGPLDGGLTLVVPRRNHGPIVAVDLTQAPLVALSIQYTGWRGTLEFEAFRRIHRVQSVGEFRDALQFFDVGSQNFSYADVHGNIAYFTSAEMPIREDLQNLFAPDGGIPPYLVRDGTHGLAHEWLPVETPQPQQSLGYEILPFAEMPQVVNPAAGFIVNANNDPIGTSLDNNPLNQLRPGGGLYYLSPGYTSLRVGRIGRLMQAALSAGQKPGIETMRSMQSNHQMLDAELLVPFVLDALQRSAGTGAPAELQDLAGDAGVAEAVARLAEWNFSTPTGIAQGYDPGDLPGGLQTPSADEVADSVAATIWSVFRGQLTRRVIDDTLAGVGLADFEPSSSLAYAAVAHHLQTFSVHQGFGASGLDFFPGPYSRVQNCDRILLQALRDALDLLAGDEFAPAFGHSTDQDDYRWGLLHRITFDHLLGGPFSIPPAAGFQDATPQLPGLARSGGYEVVDASNHSARADSVNGFTFGSGASRRFVAELDPDGIVARQIIPGGESGVLGSPHYGSQLERWLTHEVHPILLDPADVGAAAVGVANFTPTPCQPGPGTLCLQDGRFQVRANWRTLDAFGPAGAVPGASDVSGNLYFFDPANWELLVKVLDACDFDGHFWVFAGSATDVGWELRVDDLYSGESWTAENPFGNAAPAITDTAAFATCP